MQYKPSGFSNFFKQLEVPSCPVYTDECEQVHMNSLLGKAPPLLPAQIYYDYNRNPSVFRFCDKQEYAALRLARVPSLPHHRTSCECFLSRLTPYPSWPMDELTLHHAVGKIFFQTWGLVGPDLTEPLLQKCPALPEVACRLLIDHPEHTNLIEVRSSLEADFPDPVHRRFFVEYVIEAFIVHDMHRKRIRSHIFGINY